MHPILLKIGPVTIYSYGFMMALAFSIATYLIIKKARSYGIESNTILDLAIFIIISGIIGARLLYVILNIDYFLKEPIEIFMISHGGLVWYGGFITSFLGSLLYLRVKRLPVLKMIDLIIPYVAMAQAIGRIGCFLNGCCFGRATTSYIGVYIKDAFVYPTQLFESLGLIIIFFILDIIAKRKRFDGVILLNYIILYSILRFIVEFFRADNPAIFAGLTISQLISLVLFLISIAILLLKRLHRVKNS